MYLIQLSYLSSVVCRLTSAFRFIRLADEA
jgi:hypothetical protein